MFCYSGSCQCMQIFNPSFIWFPGARENGSGVYGGGFESLHVQGTNMLSSSFLPFAG